VVAVCLGTSRRDVGQGGPGERRASFYRLGLRNATGEEQHIRNFLARRRRRPRPRPEPRSYEFLIDFPLLQTDVFIAASHSFTRRTRPLLPGQDLPSPSSNDETNGKTSTCDIECDLLASFFAQPVPEINDFAASIQSCL
jgi:hypothetical protein